MKLTKGHLFLILLLTVIFCCSLGVFNVVEGMQNNNDIVKGSRVSISINNNKEFGTVMLVNEDGTYKIQSMRGPVYPNIKSENIKIVTDDEIEKIFEKMLGTKDNRYTPQSNNNRYTPQSNINGNEYSNNASYSDINDTNNLTKHVTLDDGRVIYATPQNTVNGIHGKNIPPGHDDLYILKSQVVPPVCPACPTIINKCTGGGKETPPCPPCGRCPEASFECVKRPTYKPDNPYLPIPVLSDFSSFGM